MSNTRCEALHWMSPILFIAMLISFMIPGLETVVIYLLLIGSTLAHWHYGTIIVSISFELGTLMIMVLLFLGPTIMCPFQPCLLQSHQSIIFKG